MGIKDRIAGGDIERFLAYVREYDPDFSLRITGSPPEEIAELEQVAGGALPRFYQDYLSRMGRDNGGLSLAWEANFCAPDLIDAYRVEVANGEIILPPGTILIGLGGMTIEEVLLSRTPPGEDGSVWITGSRGRWLYAEKLEHLLYQTAFTARAARTYVAFASRASITYQDNLEAVFEEARHLGFRKEWFSDINTLCATKPDGALVASRFYETELLVVIYAKTQTKANLAARYFSGAFGLT